MYQIFDKATVPVECILKHKIPGICAAQCAERLYCSAQLTYGKHRSEQTKSIDELEQFIACTSSHLQRLIATQLGLIQLASLNKGVDDVESYLELIAGNAYKLHNLSKQISKYTWNESIEISSEPIDFIALLDEIFAQYDKLKKFETLRKIIELEEHEVLFGDKERLKVILEYIIENSIKFSKNDDEEAILKIGITVNSSHAAIEIYDNGEGIHADDLCLVFNMFFKGNPYDQDLGLGLYIAKKVVLKMNGVIAVDSSWGEYTKFLITIPNMANAPKMEVD